MQISKLLTLDRIRVPMLAADKPAAIAELVDALHAAAAVRDRDAALAAVMKREAERSTGIGYGLAIPHGRTDACERLVMAAGKPQSPIEFQSADGRPVTFVVLLLSPPDQTGAHIQALAKISRLMNIEDFRVAIARATDAPTLHAAILHYEAKDPTA